MTAKGNARSSGYNRQAQDWYVEPALAVHELLDVETFDGLVWDPACGGGNIPRVCRERGMGAVGSDIVQRGPAHWVEDFLQSTCDAYPSIVTNPPFGLAEEFAAHGMRLANKVAILQRLTWLEGEGRFQRLFSRNLLARVWQFRSRISMPPGDSGAEPKGGSVAFAWFVFECAHSGAPALGWLP
jgi:hypothetical protein